MALRSAMSRPRLSRHALFFGAAIGLPCLLLVGLTLRMLAQERELGEKRLADSRRAAAANARQEVLSRLEAIRSEAIAGTPATGTVLVGHVDGGALILPWQRDLAAIGEALAEPAFADAVRRGERSEIVDRQLEAAAAAYRDAQRQARTPSQHAFATLLAARVLAKAGRTAEGDDLSRRLRALPADVTDEHGIPFALYAVRRLQDAGALTTTDREAALAAIDAACVRHASPAPPALYMCADLLAASAPTAATRAAAAAVAVRRGDAERALALRRDFAAVSARADAAASPRNSTAWVLFGAGADGWLVGIDTAGRSGTPVVAVQAQSLLDSIGSLRLRLDGRGESLGAALPGVTLEWNQDEEPLAGDLQRPFILAALALVIGMTMLGAYLFWRDVRREVRLAELRTQFVSSVSHELKTPLTAIRMFAETLLLGRSTRPGADEEYLTTIVNETERLSRLLNNVLDFSKIEQGRKTYRLEPQTLPAVVRTAARAMEYPLAQQGFALMLDVDDALPPVAADSDAIQQVVLNLLSNAMKYSGEGRTVDLRLARDNGHALISVTDRGLGIPAAEHERIFEKFYRVPGRDHDRIPGTGLGLTLVDHIVKAHGGTVAVTSAPGQGSTFSIRLPLSVA